MFPFDNGPTLLTDSYQESKDVEDKLSDLIPWLKRLKDNAVPIGADGSHEEVERREKLRRYV